MSSNIQNPIGGLWLKRFAGLGDSVFLPVQSGINSRRKTIFDEKSRQRYELYQAINCPDDTPQQGRVGNLLPTLFYAILILGILKTISIKQLNKFYKIESVIYCEI